MAGLDGDVEVPAIGSVPKKVLIPVAVGAAAFVAWRFYVSRTAGDGETSPIVDGEFGAVDTSIPGVIGAVKPDNSYGYGDPGSDADGTTAPPKTNDEWTRRAVSQLQNSDRWAYSDITTALGNYLGSRPLSTEQQDIVRAAIAIQGYPPVGTFSIISGGNTPVTVAPTNLRLIRATSTQVVIGYTQVPGALGYRAYLDGYGANVGSSSGGDITISGLAPNTSHRVQVKAFTATSEGPKSAPITVKTKAVTLGKPAMPSVSSITARTVKASTGRVSGADGYRWYVNGNLRGASEAPSYTITGLSPNTRYTVTVKADVANQSPGPESAGRSFTTKRK